MTQITHPTHYQEKLSAIALIDELVILSPIALAQALAEGKEKNVELLSPANIEDFWSSFPERPATVSALACEMKTVFLNGLDKATEHPLGPMFCVPSLLRSLVRNYVVAEAHRSARALRDRERNESVGQAD